MKKKMILQYKISCIIMNLVGKLGEAIAKTFCRIANKNAKLNGVNGYTPDNPVSEFLKRKVR
jgi:hypothetical protein